jgi:hypothetical protein
MPMRTRDWVRSEDAELIPNLRRTFSPFEHVRHCRLSALEPFLGDHWQVQFFTEFSPFRRRIESEPSVPFHLASPVGFSGA